MKLFYFVSVKAILTIGSFFLIVQFQITDAKNDPPLTCEEIKAGLSTTIPSNDFKTEEELINYIVERINTRGVKKLCSKDELPNAPDKIMEAIQNSFNNKQAKLPKYQPTLIELNGIKYVKIPRGKFSMGSNKTFPNEPHWTVPVKEIEVEDDFWMSEHEVTIGEWRKVMGKIPQKLENADSSFKGDNKPIIYVSWIDVFNFIKKLNERSADYIYALPTEAEWEYSARAGTIKEFAFGDILSKQQANFDGIGTMNVCSYRRNSWGLCDMHGNVQELVKDIFSEDYSWREAAHGTAEREIGNADIRVIRGGSWKDKVIKCRSASRTFFKITMAGNSVGFRIVAKPRESYNLGR